MAGTINISHIDGNSIASQPYINAQEVANWNTSGGALTIKGNSTAGNKTIAVTITDTNNGHTVTEYVSANTTWTLSFTQADYAALGFSNGDTLQISSAATNYTGETLGVTVAETVPAISSITTSGTGITDGSGDLNAGHTLTFTLNFNEAVYYTEGTDAATLKLSDGGTATYSGGSGTDALTFTYTVKGGQNSADLSVNFLKLDGGAIADAAGNPATLTNGSQTIVVAGTTWDSTTPYNPAGTLIIDTTPPQVTAVTDNPHTYSPPTGTPETITISFGEVVNVVGGIPTLTLSTGGGPATFDPSSSGTQALTFTYTPTSHTNGEDVTITAFNNNGATVQDAAGNNAVINVTGDSICFMPGTLIRTPSGTGAVESLAVGDLVLTSDGRAAPIRWIGRQTVSRTFADPLRSLPIRIAAGALGDNMPVRDLLVSPCHALLVDGVLVQAGALVNGLTIRRDDDVPDVFIYYHIELDDHALILAENVPAETFIDNVDRIAFDNWDEHKALYPNDHAIEEMAYPRAKAARQVPYETRARLGLRAKAVLGASAHAA